MIQRRDYSKTVGFSQWYHEWFFTVYLGPLPCWPHGCALHILPLPEGELAGKMVHQWAKCSCLPLQRRHSFEKTGQSKAPTLEEATHINTTKGHIKVAVVCIHERWSPQKALLEDSTVKILLWPPFFLGGRSLPVYTGFISLRWERTGEFGVQVTVYLQI